MEAKVHVPKCLAESVEFISDMPIRLKGRLRACGPHLRMPVSRRASQGPQEYFTKVRHTKDVQVSEVARDRYLPSRRNAARFQKERLWHEGVQLPHRIENLEFLCYKALPEHSNPDRNLHLLKHTLSPLNHRVLPVLLVIPSIPKPTEHVETQPYHVPTLSGKGHYPLHIRA